MSLSQLVQRARAALAAPSGEAIVCIWVEGIDDANELPVAIQMLGRVAEAEAEIKAAEVAGRIGSRTEMHLVGWKPAHSIMELVGARMNAANPPAIPIEYLNIMAGAGRMVAPEKRDPRLVDKLRAEASGILNRHLDDYGLKLPDEVRRFDAPNAGAPDVTPPAIDSTRFAT